MKYLIVREFENITPVVVGYDTLLVAEVLYSIDNIGKRVTMFELVTIGLIAIYKEMKTRTQE